jgi:DNA-binding MarR family transcriptional regulator
VGISVPQWRVISVIGSRPGISFGSLVGILEIDKGWISRTLTALQKDGLVTSEVDPEDKRQFTLFLTHAGQELHLKGSRISRRRQRQLASGFSSEEYKTLKLLLERLHSAVDRLE